MEVDQVGNEDVRVGVAFDHAAHGAPAAHQGHGVQGQLVAHLGGAHQAADPARGQAVHRLAHHLEVGRGVDGVVGPGAGDLLDAGEHVFTAGVQRVIRAQG